MGFSTHPYMPRAAAPAPHLAAIVFAQRPEQERRRAPQRKWIISERKRSAGERRRGMKRTRDVHSRHGELTLSSRSWQGE